ncbi:MAG: DUF1810 domain-containing protein [Rhizomicrobium sp.]
MAGYDLERFLEAQAPVYAQVTAELRDGVKRSHWMWFVFPQIEGLGESDMARRYAIHSLGEARAYLADTVLGLRLRECTALVLATRDKGADDIFGYPDTLKFHSCLTLFARAAPDSTDTIFHDALCRFYDSKADERTVARLRELQQAEDGKAS